MPTYTSIISIQRLAWNLQSESRRVSIKLATTAYEYEQRERERYEKVSLAAERLLITHNTHRIGQRACERERGRKGEDVCANNLFHGCAATADAALAMMHFPADWLWLPAQWTAAADLEEDWQGLWADSLTFAVYRIVALYRWLFSQDLECWVNFGCVVSTVRETLLQTTHCLFTLLPCIFLWIFLTQALVERR